MRAGATRPVRVSLGEEILLPGLAFTFLVRVGLLPLLLTFCLSLVLVFMAQLRSILWTVSESCRAGRGCSGFAFFFFLSLFYLLHGWEAICLYYDSYAPRTALHLPS